MVMIGCRPSSFKGDNDEMIKGWNLYLVTPQGDGHEKTIGQECERVFLTEVKLQGKHPPDFVGAEVILVYNRFGKVAEVEFL